MLKPRNVEGRLRAATNVARPQAFRNVAARFGLALVPRTFDRVLQAVIVATLACVGAPKSCVSTS